MIIKCDTCAIRYDYEDADDEVHTMCVCGIRKCEVNVGCTASGEYIPHKAEELRVEVVNWSDIKADMKYADDNNGYIYGIYSLDDEGWDIIDVQWYKSEEERQKFLSENNCIIVNE